MYTFRDNTTQFKAKATSVHFLGLMNSATKLHPARSSLRLLWRFWVESFGSTRGLFFGFRVFLLFRVKGYFLVLGFLV